MVKSILKPFIVAITMFPAPRVVGQSSVDKEYQEAVAENRRILKELNSFQVCVLSAHDDLVELRLRSSGIKFTNRDRTNSYPQLLISDMDVDLRHVVTARLREEIALPRNKNKVVVTTWQACWKIRFGDIEPYYDVRVTKPARTKEEKRQAIDEAITQFCNDYLAANPRKRTGEALVRGAAPKAAGQ